VMRKYQTPPTITDEQVKAQYDQNPILYSTAQVHASHILVKDEDTARQLLAEVKAHPEKFADLAREKSTDTVSAKKGGELLRVRLHLGEELPGGVLVLHQDVARVHLRGRVEDRVLVVLRLHLLVGDGVRCL